MLKKHIFFFVCIFLFTLFLLFANRGLDPDFGWHLRLGEIILKSGIPESDPFSYSMPTYPFVDHEWLTNIFIAFLYPKLGLTGLSFTGLSIAFLALFLQTIYVKKKYIVFPFLLSGIGLAYFLGIRPQILSWFFVSFLLLLFLNLNLWQKLRFLVPFLMLLWVNLHGSFVLGIALLGVFVLARQIQIKKLLIFDWAVVFLSTATTFINPYGWRVWWEVYMQISDTSLRWSIQEWFPAFFFFNVGFIFLLPISSLLIWRFRKKFKLHELILYLILLIFAISSTRHVPFWLLISIPMTAKAIEYFQIEIKKIRFAPQRLKLFTNIYFFVFVCMFAANFMIIFLPFKYQPFSAYPEKATSYLKANTSKGNIFSHYNWGGYLIWKYPEEKVFVDGRMPSWRDQSTPFTSGKNAFAEYQEVMDGKSELKVFLTKYNIDTVFLKTKDEVEFPVWLEEGIEKTLGVKFASQQLLKKQLEKEGMKVIYKDDIAVIYRR